MEILEGGRENICEGKKIEPKEKKVYRLSDKKIRTKFVQNKQNSLFVTKGSRQK